MNIQTILSQIDQGAWALPEFQRGYVWNRVQVRDFMKSLYMQYPVGSLLVWTTKTESASYRGDSPPAYGTVKLILDGQQRITSLYGIIKGAPPPFFEGNADSFTNLHFNIEEEVFEFYSPARMKDNPVWVDVTDVMKNGVGGMIDTLYSTFSEPDQIRLYLSRLNRLDNVKNRDLYSEDLSTDEMTLDVVVDIFNKVNSGGTHLSKGDLALAKMCAQWPDARAEMNRRLNKWKDAGYVFKLDWLLRCVNTITTGEALFSYLENLSVEEFQGGLDKAERHIDSLLNLIATRLGLDHDRVLGSRYSFPLMVRYLDQKGGTFSDQEERDKSLYWYIHTFMWGRYAGSTESYLNVDLAAIEDLDGGLDRLISELRTNRGDLRLSPADFDGWSKGSRFYPMLYMMTRVQHSIDLVTGVELSEHLLGRSSSLEVHHIFPKSKLYEHGYSKAEVNAIANFTFLTKESNLEISNKDPHIYLEEIASGSPGALESHWIPMDRELWLMENYLEFLAARRQLLADAANEFMDSLYSGTASDEPVSLPLESREPVSIGGVATEEEEEQLFAINEWARALDLPEGDLLYDLADEETGQPIAVIDLAWPDGLQPGLTEPVALMIDEDPDLRDRVSQSGYRVFTDEDSFKRYVSGLVVSQYASAV